MTEFTENDNLSFSVFLLFLVSLEYLFLKLKDYRTCAVNYVES